MAKGKSRGIMLIVIVALLIVGAKAVSQYNNLVRLDEEVNNSWAQVQNVLQRRMDLIPNLVSTVKGYASHERETLEAVIQARANASKMEVNAESLMENPQLMEQFSGAQNQLSQALSRLMVVVERYPDLKANQSFLKLQDELAGTENRIAVERKRFNDTVREYSMTRRRFPTNIFAGIFGFEARPYFEAPEAAQQAPQVQF